MLSENSRLILVDFFKTKIFVIGLSPILGNVLAKKLIIEFGKHQSFFSIFDIYERVFSSKFSNFILLAAFRRVYPKSIKMTVKLLVILRF